MFRKVIFVLILVINFQYSHGQERVYDYFIKDLPIDSTFIDDYIISYNNYWEKFVNVSQRQVLKKGKEFGITKSAMDNYKRPDLSPFLSRKFFLGSRIILEKQSKEANRVIGFAKCIEGVPTIVFASKQSPKICMEAFVFFREHEFAHLKLGHAGCGVSSNVFDSHQKEKDADVEAMKTILTLPDGYRIIDFIIATFYTLNLDADQYHPSSYDRIQNLLRN